MLWQVALAWPQGSYVRNGAGIGAGASMASRSRIGQSRSRFALRILIALSIPLSVLGVLLTQPKSDDEAGYLLIAKELKVERSGLQTPSGRAAGGADAPLELMDPAQALPAVFSHVSGDMEAHIPQRHFSLSAGAAEEGLNAESQPIYSAWQGRVRNGESLVGLLRAKGVSADEAEAAAKALGQVFDSRKLKAGHVVELAMVPSLDGDLSQSQQKLVSLTLSPSAVADHIVSRGDGGFTATSIERPVTRQLVYRSGVINGSFFGAGKRAGVPHKHLVRLVKGFSYDVDFQRDLKAGDRFELAFEAFVNDEGEIAYTGEVVYGALVLGSRRKEIYRFTPKSGRADFFNAKGESVRKALLRTPVDGARISSRFGMRRHPILGYSKMHKGIDFAASRGTPIFAAGDGVIKLAKWNGGYGRYIRIQHGSGYQTAYAHMTRFAKGMRAGKKVRQGQVIGYVGTTGRSTGPHLHYEVLKGGKQVNPLSVKLLPGEKLKGGDLKGFKKVRAQVDEARRNGGQIFVAKRSEN